MTEDIGLPCPADAIFGDLASLFEHKVWPGDGLEEVCGHPDDETRNVETDERTGASVEHNLRDVGVPVGDLRDNLILCAINEPPPELLRTAHTALERRQIDRNELDAQISEPELFVLGPRKWRSLLQQRRDVRFVLLGRRFVRLR